MLAPRNACAQKRMRSIMLALKIVVFSETYTLKNYYAQKSLGSKIKRLKTPNWAQKLSAKKRPSSKMSALKNTYAQKRLRSKNACAQKTCTKGVSLKKCFHCFGNFDVLTIFLKIWPL